MKIIDRYRFYYCIHNIPSMESTYNFYHSYKYRNLIDIYGQEIKKTILHGYDVLSANIDKENKPVLVHAFSLFQILEITDDICVISILQEKIDSYKPYGQKTYIAIPLKLGNAVFIPELSCKQIEDLKIQVSRFPKKYISIYDIYEYYGDNPYNSWKKWLYPLIAIFKCTYPEIIKTMSHGLIDMLQMFLECNHNTIRTYKTDEMTEELSLYIQKLYKAIHDMDGFYNYKEIPSVIDILNQHERDKEEKRRLDDKEYEIKQKETNVKADVFLRNAKSRRELLDIFSEKNIRED